MKVVSIIIPIYNEEKHIIKCIKSIMDQDFPHNQMEIIFLDGGSSDNTISLLKEYMKKDQCIQLYLNPKRTAPYAMNLGIKKATGKYIIRMDAHCEYAHDYISQCVIKLEETGADNVGGIIDTKSHGYIGDAIALMLSCKFGVGDSQFRTNGADGYVDTVPFGAFRKEVFERWGDYDERLTRNQDSELNYRIRKNGGKIYLSNTIKSTYFCRDTIQGICKMAFGNGKWNIITSYLCPGSMRLRHFIPFIFVLSLLLLPLLFIVFEQPFFYFLFLGEVGLYLFFDFLFSLKIGLRKNMKYFPVLLVLFPLFHVFYGTGSFAGIFQLPGIERRRARKDEEQY